MLALNQIKKNGEKGKGFAIVGIIVGMSPILLLLLFFVYLFSDFGIGTLTNMSSENVCSVVDINGNYEQSGVKGFVFGYVKCENNICKVNYGNEEYEFDCLKLKDKYE